METISCVVLCSYLGQLWSELIVLCYNSNFDSWFLNKLNFKEAERMRTVQTFFLQRMQSFTTIESGTNPIEKNVNERGIFRAVCNYVVQYKKMLISKYIKCMSFFIIMRLNVEPHGFRILPRVFKVFKFPSITKYRLCNEIMS